MHRAERRDGGDSHMGDGIAPSESSKVFGRGTTESGFAERAGRVVTHPQIAVVEGLSERRSRAWIVDLPKRVRGGGAVAWRLAGQCGLQRIRSVDSVKHRQLL